MGLLQQNLEVECLRSLVQFHFLETLRVWGQQQAIRDSGKRTRLPVDPAQVLLLTRWPPDMIVQLKELSKSWVFLCLAAPKNPASVCELPLQPACEEHQFCNQLGWNIYMTLGKVATREIIQKEDTMLLSDISTKSKQIQNTIYMLNLWSAQFCVQTSNLSLNLDKNQLSVDPDNNKCSIKQVFTLLRLWQINLHTLWLSPSYCVARTSSFHSVLQ